MNKQSNAESRPPATQSPLGESAAGIFAIVLAFLLTTIVVAVPLWYFGSRKDDQVLPNGFYLQDDVQYFAPGPEFKLAREAEGIVETDGEVTSD